MKPDHTYQDRTSRYGKGETHDKRRSVYRIASRGSDAVRSAVAAMPQSRVRSTQVLFSPRGRYAAKRVQNVSRTLVELSGIVERSVDVRAVQTHYESSACRQKSRAITNLEYRVNQVRSS
jgi:hypothetical protein